MKSGARMPLPSGLPPIAGSVTRLAITESRGSCIARARRIDGAARGSRATERSQDDAGLIGSDEPTIVEPCERSEKEWNSVETA
jgi:hypothetical protein